MLSDQANLSVGLRDWQQQPKHASTEAKPRSKLFTDGEGHVEFYSGVLGVLEY